MNRVCFDAKEFPVHYASEMATNYIEAHPDRAGLVSSLLPNGWHAPALDIDMPVSIRESSPGHFHVFIDAPMSWWRYRLLLWALWWGGVIERGFYKASVRRRRTQLRTVNLPKAGSQALRNGVV